MIPTHFNLLFSNLIEIYTATAQKKDKQPLSLFATSSTHVYDTKNWTGTAIQAFYTGLKWIQPGYPLHSVDKALQFIFNQLFPESVYKAYAARQHRILNCLMQLNQLFEADHLKQQERYENFLSKEFKEISSVPLRIEFLDFEKNKDKVLSEIDIKILRHTIINFQQATDFFWSLWMKKERSLEQKQKFDQLYATLIPYIDNSSAFLDRSLFKALKKEYQWVNLEGITAKNIPFVLLAKLQNPSSLSLNESILLKAWVQSLNQQPFLTTKQLFAVLTEVISLIHLQSACTTSLTDILMWLSQNDCQLLQQPDSAHLDWREKLKPGDLLACNSQKFKLGLLISPDKLVNDKYKIFELEDHPDWVIKIGDNLFCLLIEARQAQDEQAHAGIRLVETIANIQLDKSKEPLAGIDKKGLCVIIEKLSLPWSECEWTSQSFNLNAEDEHRALVFANHIFCLSQWNFALPELSIAHLMTDDKGRLKSTRLLKKIEGDYNKWENDCITVAKGNPYILNFIMHVSKLQQHPIARYYREAVEYTLQNGKTDLITRPLPLKHRLPHYTSHIQTLCQEALDLKKTCFEHVQALLRRKNQHTYHQDSQLQKRMAVSLIQAYQSSSISGAFLGSLKEEVINLYSESKTDLFEISKEIELYYQEQHRHMISLNQAMLNI